MSLSALNESIRALSQTARRSLVAVKGRRAPSTGIAWTEDGLVAASEHTLEWDDLRIATPEGEIFGATLVGRDPTTDLALLRAEGARLTPPAWAGTDALGAGEIGLVAAASRTGTRVSLASASVVGPEWNAETGGRVDRYIEIDCGLFPGFSGSLFLDGTGRALGMNTAGLRRQAPLVLPSETLRRVLKHLLDHGEVRRGFLGVTTYPVRLPETISSQRLGLLVLSVQKESPAAEAPLFLGDVILDVEGRAVESPVALVSHLTEESIGRQLQARILRAGAEQRVSITVGVRK